MLCVHCTVLQVQYSILNRWYFFTCMMALYLTQQCPGRHWVKTNYKYLCQNACLWCMGGQLDIDAPFIRQVKDKELHKKCKVAVSSSSSSSYRRLPATAPSSDSRYHKQQLQVMPSTHGQWNLLQQHPPWRQDQARSRGSLFLREERQPQAQLYL